MVRCTGILVLLAAMTPLYARAQHYSGPPSLGPFRIDKNVSMSSMFQQLGRPSSINGETYCYRSERGEAFLSLTRLDPVYDDPQTAGALTLSRSANCSKRNVQITSADIAHWKTEKGIGLFSPESAVVDAYGPPTSTLEVNDLTCGLTIYGDREGSSGYSSSKAGPGCTVLVYKGTPEELSTAEFGIKQGKVVWIMLSQNE